MKKLFIIFVIFFITVPLFVSAEEFEDDYEYHYEFDESENTRQSGNFWIAISPDTALYSTQGFAFGGSLSLGYGSGSCIGLKATWFFSEEGIDTMELCFILRFYMLKGDVYSGPFLQFLGGPSIYNRAGSFEIPSNSGMISAGLSFGWRFLFFNRIFVEPSVRGGYPYLFGASISTGVSF